MDDFTRAIYRTGCLVAAAHNAAEPLELRDLVDRANDLYELYVSAQERHDDVFLPPMDPEAEKAFLERARQQASQHKDRRDKEKMARAVAMVDQEHMERTDPQEEMEVRR